MFAFSLVFALAVTKLLADDEVVEVVEVIAPTMSAYENETSEIQVENFNKIHYLPKRGLIQRPTMEARLYIFVRKTNKNFLKQVQKIGMQQNGTNISPWRSPEMTRKIDKNFNWCLINPRFRNGNMTCKTFKQRSMYCRITCRKGFKIGGLRSRIFYCKRHQNTWRPRMGICLYDYKEGQINRGSTAGKNTKLNGFVERQKKCGIRNLVSTEAPNSEPGTLAHGSISK